ncbi:larval cuticle protein A1A-like isoform X2 [Achroia grisella]|nr:larval cuticle protein A1A-like isoform X2 [Achroia grisella]
MILGIIVTDPPPTEAEYKYSYDIDDPTTGDTKSQYEVRQGGTVSGAYTVVDPDGIKRTVEYTADPKEGFKATVRKEPVDVIAAQKNPQYISKENTYYPYEAQYKARPHYVTDVRMDDSFTDSETQFYDKDNYIQHPVYFKPASELNSGDPTYENVHREYFTPTNK